MAYGLRCYCCGVSEPASAELFYCKPCLFKLAQIFKEGGSGILENPKSSDHCVSCGEWEGRRIIYTGLTGFFPGHVGDGVPICDLCVEEELKDLDKETTN